MKVAQKEAELTEYRYFLDRDRTVQRERKDGTGGGEVLWPDGTWAPWPIKHFDVREMSWPEARAQLDEAILAQVGIEVRVSLVPKGW